MKIETPCVNICKLDERGICIGCFRSLQEIAAWSRMSEAERRLIMAGLVGTPCYGVPTRVIAGGKNYDHGGITPNVAPLVRGADGASAPSLPIERIK